MSTHQANLEPKVREGKHSPAEWIRLLFSLQAEGFSGELSLRSGAQSRQYLLINGHLMNFRSTHRDETLAKSLVKSKLVDQNAVLDLDEFQVEIAILEEELLSDEALEAHFESRLQMGIVAGLIQNTGTWEVRGQASLSAVEVSRALYPKMDLWNVLWGGVKIHLSTKELMAWAGKKGRVFRRSKKLSLPYVETANSDFLTDCATAENLGDFLQVVAHSEDIAARIWILTAAGIYDLLDGFNESAASPSLPVETVRTPTDAAPVMSRTPLPTIPKPSGNQAEDIAAEHHQRMGKNYYAFLGLPATASAEELRDVSRSMAQRMNALSRSPALSQETRLLVQDMLSGVQRAYGTFTDRKRKEDYDRQMVEGGAGTIQSLPASAVPPQAAKSGDFSSDAKEQNDDGWSFLKMGKKP